MKTSQYLVAVTLLLISATAHARYQPLTGADIHRLVARKARVYVARPCKVQPATRGGARERFRVLPGDVLRAAAARMAGDRVLPSWLVVKARGGQQVQLQLKCLSAKPLDYSYRRGSFRAFTDALVKDLPRQMERYLAIARKHKFDVPSRDPKTGERNHDYDRYRALRKQLQWTRMRYFDMAYRGKGERAVLKREADWITRRGEAFIRGFAGNAPDKDKARLKKIYLLLNKLDNVPYHCGKIARLQQQAKKLTKGDDRYKDLAPAHAARLLSEDLVKVQTDITQRQAKIATAMATVRAGLMAQGIKLR